MIYTCMALALLLCIFLFYKYSGNKKNEMSGRNKKYGRRMLTGITLITTGVYLGFRITVIPMTQGWDFAAGLLLLLAELIGIAQFVDFLWLFSGEYRLPHKTMKGISEADFPQVDVLICTYNEPVSLLKKTMAAAQAMNYPKDKMHIFVCDDGNRKELKEVCGQFGAGYISRTDNHGAKAGNLNHALKVTDGELFAVLDADMLPKENFLLHTVAYFEDEKTAFVQTPQVYYNADMYQYRLKKNIPNEQDFFMRNVESARAAHDAVLHVGTNAVFRRRAVEEVGGYPTDSITEDMVLGLLLQEAGYRSVFVNEELVLGLSAATYSELVRQRDRWCRGNLQAFRKYNPWKMKRLTAAQKMAYTDGVIYWCSSLQKVIYVLAPLVYFLFGIKAVDTQLPRLLIFFLPFVAGQILSFRAFAPDTRSLFWAHIYEIAMAPHISFSVLKEVFHLKTGFNVTAKDVTYQRWHYQFKTALPQLLFLMLSLLACLAAFRNWTMGNLEPSAFLMNLAWGGYNFAAVAFCCILACQKPIFRKSERVEIRTFLEARVMQNGKTVSLRVGDLSEEGCRLTGSGTDCLLEKEALQVSISGVCLQAELVRREKEAVCLKFFQTDVREFREVVRLYLEHLQAYSAKG